MMIKSPIHFMGQYTTYKSELISTHSTPWNAKKYT